MTAVHPPVTRGLLLRLSSENQEDGYLSLPARSRARMTNKAVSSKRSHPDPFFSRGLAPAYVYLCREVCICTHAKALRTYRYVYERIYIYLQACP